MKLCEVYRAENNPAACFVDQSQRAGGAHMDKPVAKNSCTAIAIYEEEILLQDFTGKS